MKSKINNKNIGKLQEANKKYSITLSILTLLLLSLSIILSQLSLPTVLNKFLSILLLIIAVVLMIVSYDFLKICYSIYRDTPNPPLFVPKVYGLGFSINPYHKYGKVIFLIIFTVIIGSFIPIIISIFQ